MNKELKNKQLKALNAIKRYEKAIDNHDCKADGNHTCGKCWPYVKILRGLYEEAVELGALKIDNSSPKGLAW